MRYDVGGAGVVDENVDAAVALGRGVDEPTGLCRVRDGLAHGVVQLLGQLDRRGADGGRRDEPIEDQPSSTK
jgi:hypothetical protein